MVWANFGDYAKLAAGAVPQHRHTDTELITVITSKVFT